MIYLIDFYFIIVNDFNNLNFNVFICKYKIIIIVLGFYWRYKYLLGIKLEFKE